MIHPLFVYLFFVDLASLYEQTYKKYSIREPKYGVAWLEAYLFAYQYSGQKGRLSHELILGTHKKAMAWQNPTNSALAGHYKNCHNHFQAHPSHVLYEGLYCLNQTYNMSHEGVHQFIDKNLTEHCTYQTTIVFTISDSENSCIQRQLFVESFNPETHLFHYVEFENQTLESSDAKDSLTIHQLVDSYLQNSTVSIKIYPAEKLSVSEIHLATKAQMTTIIDNFNQNIESCRTDEERFKTIINTIQQIDQCHPFIDGNIRCCYILLNKLLDDFNLGKTLLYNPNGFDLYTLEELYDLVKQGQTHYRKLYLHQSSAPFKYQYNILGYDASVNCLPQNMPDVSDALLQQFQSVVIAQEPRLSQPIQAAKLGLFTAKPHFCKNDSMNQLIEEGSYNQAL
ncbi:MAG: hypothetical protein CMF38_01125 [Legionellaceae bacterium]|nr:hypothetical protein [Legionellaceae bacterium]HAF88112.1 hypothetical protein [Legionellales bacterium]HCA89103.1 hypothetical protein [Legionellales bacterium]|tara:strand:+ start:478 stop:1665 length:1188 start_codon:yes stop_codon:yes gene_type:complete